MQSHTSFVGNEIRRCTRVTLVTCLVGLGFVAAAFGGPWKYWLNWARGPFPVDRHTLAQLRRLDATPLEYVRLPPSAIANTGYSRDQPELDDDGHDTGRVRHEGLYLVRLGDKSALLETELAPDAVRGGKLNVELAPMDELLRTTVLPRLFVEDAALKQTLLPYMLKTGDYTASGNAALWFLIPLAALFAVFGGLGLSWRGDGTKHPAYKALRRYGDPGELVRKIDQEIAGQADLFESKGGLRSGTIRVTRSWLLSSHAFRFAAIPLDEVAWVHKHVLRYNLVLKIVSLVVYTRAGKRHSISVATMTEKPCDELIAQLQRRRAWLFAGYDRAFAKRWRGNRAEVLAALDDRKRRAAEPRSA